jgi:hypothetical protein
MEIAACPTRWLPSDKQCESGPLRNSAPEPRVVESTPGISTVEQRH